MFIGLINISYIVPLGPLAITFSSFVSFCSCNHLRVSMWQMNTIQIQIILTEININNMM